MLTDTDIDQKHVIERMTDIVACLNSCASIENFLLDIHCILQKVTYADNFYVVLQDENERLTFPYFHDVKDSINVDSLQGIDKEALSHTLTAYALSGHKVCNYQERDIQNLIDSGTVNMLGSLPKQWLCFPLTHHDVFLGAFIIQSYRNENEYDSTIVDVLFTISHVISSALDAFRMQQALLKANNKLQSYQLELEAKVKKRTEQLEQSVNELKKEVTYRKELQSELEHESLHDSLTKLANRKYLFKKIDELSAKHLRNPQNIYLMYLDLDGFKQVNDNLGHPAGDAVLVEVSDRIQKMIRPYDFAARVGGDEFIIIFDENMTYDEVCTISQRIIDAVCDRISSENQTVTVGVSIGISSTVLNSLAPTDLIHYADIALYQSKANGKRQFTFHQNS
ncbi:diguanylate cyclase domain-containing protein [Pseudoalteromonas sp. G4]|uniref:diguanylate cyclase domain-containing protein n=1 Tax=Pseudoalteromonas sp. G4 TaxID=2992761 RepID=UPI00237EE5DC|nr:diguanylate cyclase [Pseudoalteromonas sp. G4]MDE3273271.1 diguanylate cyclase [Pseudoalteromonas sp. G4]